MKTEQDFPYTVTICILGGIVLVKCKHKRCAEDIKKSFASNIVEKAWSNPDVIITCDWECAGRYLFRTRPKSEPEVLEGVSVFSKGQIEYQAWKSFDPPIPPFTLFPFKERFVGFHGAAVRTQTGNGVLILGERGSGKTTSSLELSNRYGCKVLTDETIFIHKRSNIVEPFLREIKIRKLENDQIHSVILPANVACENVQTESVIANQIIFLEPAKNSFKSYMSSVSKSDTLKLLLKHHIDLGCNLDEAMFTLAYLANNLRASVFYYSTYDELLRLGSKIVENKK